MKKICFVTFIAVCLAILSSSTTTFAQDAKKVESKDEAQDVYAVWDKLVNKNTDMEFDTPLTVTGIVLDKGISIYATPYVSLSNKDNGTCYARCVLPRTDVAKLSNFQKGQKVKMSGHYYSKKDAVIIKKCKLIN